MLVLDNGDAIRGIAEVASKLDFIVNGYVGTAATQLADGQLANVEGDLYQSGANATVVTSITIVNTDSAARTFTLYLKPSGGTSRAISPVSLDLGVGHSFYTDGQRITVMDASGQILSIWAVDDTPVDGATTVPISSNRMYDHENTPALAHLLYQLTTRAHVIWVPIASDADLAAGGGWTAVTAGTGGTSSIKRNTLRVRVNSDTGSALWWRQLSALGIGSTGLIINWDKELYLQFALYRETAGGGAADIQGYVQLKSKNTIGALDDEGIGIRIGKGDATGLTIQGESWESALGEATFNASLTSGDYVIIGIHHRPGVSVDFYRDGVLQANTITGATKVPAGVSGTVALVVSLETTDDCVSDIKMDVGNFFIVQAH